MCVSIFDRIYKTEEMESSFNNTKVKYKFLMNIFCGIPFLQHRSPLFVINVDVHALKPHNNTRMPDMINVDTAANHSMGVGKKKFIK